ncbi:hypothetical protein E5D57_013626 [Metarhizium anisopliae]|nr:hypothetical protein E5D57_013626 [Metarhizium anisopliae]
MPEFLLDRQSDPDAKSEFGETPLRLATKQDLYGPQYPDYVDHWADPTNRIEFALKFIDRDDDDDEEFCSTKITPEEQRITVLHLVLNH